EPFESPLEAELPLSIPGTRLSIDGSGKVSILSAADYLEKNRALAGGQILRECPAVPCGESQIWLKPSLLNLPGMDLAEGLRGLPADFQDEHAPLMARSLAVLAKHQADPHEHIAAMLRVLIVKPITLGGLTNVSHSDLPGAAICGLVPDPYLMADTVIHEFH